MNIEDKVYTQEELQAHNILTDGYRFLLQPGVYFARLDLKAKSKSCLRVFFTLDDGRKILATTQWFQRYLGFYEIPVGTRLRLVYEKKTGDGVYLTHADIAT